MDTAPDHDGEGTGSSFTSRLQSDLSAEEEEDELEESEYERKRKERMAQNKAFMASLGFTEGETSLKSMPYSYCPFGHLPCPPCPPQSNTMLRNEMKK